MVNNGIKWIISQKVIEPNPVIILCQRYTKGSFAHKGSKIVSALSAFANPSLICGRSKISKSKTNGEFKKIVALSRACHFFKLLFTYTSIRIFKLGFYNSLNYLIEYQKTITTDVSRYDNASSRSQEDHGC